jgi:hypothetical protein
VHRQYAVPRLVVPNIPAGSFKCERFVRSSLASSMAGFISGGRFGSLPSLMEASVVSTVLVWGHVVSHVRLPRCRAVCVHDCVPRHSRG